MSCVLRLTATHLVQHTFPLLRHLESSRGFLNQSIWKKGTANQRRLQNHVMGLGTDVYPTYPEPGLISPMSPDIII